MGIETESDVSGVRPMDSPEATAGGLQCSSTPGFGRWALYYAVMLMVTVPRVSAQKEVAVGPGGDTSLTIQSGSKVRVTISTHEVQNGTPSKPVKPKHSACTMSRMPCSVVDAIAVTVNGKPLFVPRSVFCDLADANTASLKAAASGWVVTLVGGDASESYGLTIEFDAKHISRRMFTDGESGQKLQETNYYEATD